MSNDLFKSLDDIIELGFDRILTSGGKNTCIDGIDVIKKLILNSKNGIIIMPGSGIKLENIHKIAECKTSEFHMSARSTIVSKMKFINKDCSLSKNDYILDSCNTEVISKIIDIINKN